MDLYRGIKIPMTINDQIQNLCREFGGYLHCSACQNYVSWQAIQVRSEGDHSAGTYRQECRSAAGHPTPEMAIAACLATEWIPAPEVSK